MHRPTVLLMSGSIRRDGLHRRLAAALRPLLVDAGVSTDLIDLGEFPMPVYHGDLEAEHGPPAAAVALHELIGSVDGLIVLSPEHNGGPSALLKNTIDWLTRVDRATFAHLLVGLAATSPGRRGGVAGLASLRAMLTHMRLHLVDADLSIPTGGEAFAVGDGGVEFVRDDDRRAALGYVERYVAALARHIAERDEPSG